jgi:non-ribosomal peptide synthetase component E (peptide arylation enzyme)
MTGLGAAVAHPPEDVRRFVDAGYWTDETPQHWLAGWAARRPDAPAAIGIDETMSYGELYDRARRIATGLIQNGFRKGDVIGIQLPNSWRFMALFNGIQQMGGVPCLLHMPYRAGELGPMLAHARAKGVVCFNALADYDAPATMRDVQKAVPSLETVIVAEGEAPAGTLALSDLLATEPSEIVDPPAPADPGLIAFTSGTSMSPKAVVHSYRTMASCFRLSVATTGWTPDDVVLSAPPFTHAFGIIVLTTALCAGSAAALMPAYAPDALAEVMSKTRTTSLCCGPAHVFATARAGLLGPGTTDTLRSAFVGGSACPPEAIQTLQDACPNGTIYQIWGMTEVLLGVLSPLDASLDVRLRSVGKVSVGHDLRVVAEDGAVLGTDQEGELQIRGPFVIHRYLDNDQANRDAFTEDNWYRTGDLMRIDADGNISMTGRVKDVINRGGVKINPVDIEQALEEHPAVVQVAIIPYPDQVLGERACLVIVPNGDAALSMEEMQRYLASRGIAKMRWPERIETVQAMPMTPTRKIIKGELARQVLGTR